jgi:hypothetical protein
MMTFHARYADNRLTNVHLGGGDFDQIAEISLDLIEHADTRFLAYDQDLGVVSMYVDEGAARYGVMRVDETRGVVWVALWRVERPCTVCKLRGEGRHQWWCSRAA